jgi:NAD(P)-dependent dehydrogenase (short-subunit alcohol dehydrogenase family)
MRRDALAGKVALVTGASRGIGRAIAVELGACGAVVGLGCRRRSAALDSALDEVLTAGAAAAYAVEGDLLAPAAAKRMVDETIQTSGTIDILINNAAVQRSAMAHKMSDDDWLEVIALDLSAAFFTSRAALAVMRAKRSGHIVNVASASSVLAQPGAASYVAAKHGLIGLTKALAVENAGHGVLVNAIAPGLTRTDMTLGLSDEQRDGLMKRVPLGRLAEAREHARLVRWLVTEASYSTGNVFHASGGVVMG